MSKKPEMTLVPIAELTGEALNYAAARADGLKPTVFDGRGNGGALQTFIPSGRRGSVWYRPDVEDLIERHKMWVSPPTPELDAWAAARSLGGKPSTGRTLAEAVTRTHVASAAPDDAGVWIESVLLS